MNPGYTNACLYGVRKILGVFITYKRRTLTGNMGVSSQQVPLVMDPRYALRRNTAYHGLNYDTCGFNGSPLVPYKDAYIYLTL